MPELYRYAAFISYSSKDAAFAKRLHGALERYGIPSSLGTFDLIGGGKKNRIYPVFRDREELSAGNLGDRIEASLRASASLIVLCSPNSATSPWVQKEIEYFISLGRRDRIFAIISSDAPVRDAKGGDATRSSFPAAFLGDALAGNALEPLAADARKGKDGFRSAVLKTVAGLIGVSPGKLADRDARRRRRQWIAAASAALAIGVGGSIAYAFLDGRTWRKDLSAFATDLVSRKRTYEALPFGLASLPAPGDILPYQDLGSEEQLRRGGASLLTSYDLGNITYFEFSPDEKVLLAIHPGQLGELIELMTGKRTPVGAIPNMGGTFGFTEDGQYFGKPESDGTTTLFDLKSGMSEPIGAVDTLRASRDGRYMLVVDSASEGTLHDIQSGSHQELGPIQWAEKFEDSRFLKFRTPEGNWAILDLKLGERTELGPSYSDVQLSADGRYVLTTETEDVPVLRDLVSSRVERLPKGTRAAFSSTGKYLLMKTQPDQLSLRDLSSASVKQVGYASDVTPPFVGLSRDDKLLIARQIDGKGILTELESGRTTELGYIASFKFSGDGKYLATTATDDFSDGPGTLWNLPDMKSTPFEPAVVAEFSADSRFLAIQTEKDESFLIELTSGETIPVGPSGQDKLYFSPGGRYVMALNDGGYGVRDLSRNALRSRGEAYAVETCSGPEEAVRPFPPAIRTGSDVTTPGIYEAIRGRPWNPCDWRGLGSGDEGMAQWLRRVEVHVLGNKDRDYKCGEIDATGHTSLARLKMCHAAGVPEEWLAPTQQSAGASD